MILLTGVTGTTGSLLLQALKNKDVPMRAMLRDPSKLNSSEIANLEIVEGDFDNEASLAKAMTGVEKAFMLMPNIEEQLDNEKRFIDVAKKPEYSIWLNSLLRELMLIHMLC
ncbi:MAG: NAD(P)H-binding protein [Gammaproteobacteria bacterium]|nr:NAD(P)H-binding protein [Gammaproteobacteria bacterium]